MNITSLVETLIQLFVFESNNKENFNVDPKTLVVNIELSSTHWN